MTSKSETGAERDGLEKVETMTLTDIVERVPPSILQLLVATAPTINLVHRFLMLATWRGGYHNQIGSWLLLLAYALVCLYGYEVLRYAPQVLPLSWIVYTAVCASFDRVTGRHASSPGGATSHTIKRAMAQLCDISDFVAAVCETVVYPFGRLLSAQVQGTGVRSMVVFLLASWPVWLLCMLPREQWITPFYFVRTHSSDLAASTPAVAFRTWVRNKVAPKALLAASTHAPRLLAWGTRTAARAAVYAEPMLRHSVPSDAKPWTLTVQIFPPPPVAALRLRHVLLVVGCTALTWCSPWATLIRRALWHSAVIRHTVLGLARLLSGTQNVCDVWRSVRPHRVHGETSALATASADASAYETVFQFEIYENQRWWIGLDWTAALLPQERPSWSDCDNNAVTPPSSFALPKPTRTLVASSFRPGRQDRRTAEWHWVDLEWRVAGAQSITSSVYTPASAMPASEAQRLSARIGAEMDQNGNVLDATDRMQASTNAAAAPKPAVEAAEEELPAEIQPVARRATEASHVVDVDAEGWQYGDNAWEKLSAVNGMGRYTRRRCWIRRAVLVQTVEYGVEREPL